ncbi:family 78 glycoside hydrolase catalytic domain [Microbacterium sp. AZCO]|uniref:family 78 glycoside hydrolase catalytic domain n=1 Tax=Microbacterium sp. AZCO TaxID=3142976 RepID=UPI0031F3BF07
MELARLRTLNRIEPLGIDQTPEFSWMLRSSARDTVQSSYRIVVTAGPLTVWDSGRVDSDAQSFIAYAGEPLRSRTEYRWTVTVTDNHGHTASASAGFETALFADDWRAQWAESTIPRPAAEGWGHGTQPPAVEFLRDFRLDGAVRRARLYATALGAYRLTVNGVRPDDRELAPEFSVYRSRLYVQTYDVTAFLRVGGNELSMYVGDGWYHCPVTRPLSHAQRETPAVLFQLELEYADGTTQIVSSDDAVTCRTGPVQSSDLYWGERYDATAIPSVAQRARVVNLGYDNLVAQPLEPIRAVAVLPAVSLHIAPSGDRIIDFGQIVAGRVRVRIDAPHGTEVALEHFEATTPDGEYFNGTLAGQKDVYVSDGKPQIYEPIFTFHGFRYLRVTGLEAIDLADFEAVVLSTPKDSAGSFESSDARLNRLHENVVWSQRNNTMSIPTDCPTREKAGFTGDIQMYAPAAYANEDMTSFLEAWLRNLEADQLPDGVVPMTVPFTTLYESLSLRMSAQFGTTGVTGIAGWSDAAVIVPWEIYRATGSTAVLERSYASMKAWCDSVIDTARHMRGSDDIPEELDRHLWNTGFHFGEWLIPSQHQKEGDWDNTRSSAFYVAPFFGYRSLSLFAQVARLLDRDADHHRYLEEAEATKAAIQRVFMSADELPTPLMGGYVLAFAFGLVPDERRMAYGAKLVSILDDNDGLLDTGFVATPYLLDVLVEIGRPDLAVGLVWEDRMPSWLYQVDQGATAIWENWDAIAPDGMPTTSSLDHYAFGAVDDWITREIAGIQAAAPGYKRIVIAPRTDVPLTFCARTLLTPYGEVGIHWTTESLDVTIPANTTAVVHWGGDVHAVGSGSYHF